MYPLSLTASDAAAWVGLITAITAGVVSIIAALKGQKADTKADVLSGRVEAQSQTQRALRSDLLAVALNTPAPGNGPGQPAPPAAGYPLAGYPETPNAAGPLPAPPGGAKW